MSSSVPLEFQAAHVEANSPLGEQIYTEKLRSPFPAKSFGEQGFVFRPSSAASADEIGVDLEDKTLYYNTQSDERSAYWREHGPLPSLTKDIHRMRHDFKEYGYCLVQAAFSPEQLAVVRERVVEQAAGERAVRSLYQKRRLYW